MTIFNSRIARKFQALKAEGKTAFVSFLTAGDPDAATSNELLRILPQCGVDIVEIGMPFSDPMADGAAIQEANNRALAAGMTVEKTLRMAADFRILWPDVPVVLMGYFNPILHFGVQAFVNAASAAGVDGLIIVDLPPEEDAELRLPANAAGIEMIRLVTPTTDQERLPTVLRDAQGFIYCVTVTGITGARSAVTDSVAQRLAWLRQHTDLPLVAGFGISSAEQVKALQGVADGIVVGSAIIRRIAANLDATNKSRENLVQDVTTFVHGLTGAKS